MRGVCLDIDDTLVDSDGSIRAGLREMLGTDDGWADWRAVSERHYRRFTAGEVDFETMRRQRTGEFFACRGEVLDEARVTELEQRRMAAARHAWRLFEDVPRCLHRLHAAGLKLAAVTNAPGAYQRDKLDALGLAGAFHTMITSDEFGAAKPDRGIFHAACAALDSPPGQAVHIGDRLDVDACGARDAGMYGVWLHRSGSTVVDPGAGISVLPGLDGLVDLVTRLGSPRAEPGGKLRRASASI